MVKKSFVLRVNFAQVLFTTIDRCSNLRLEGEGTENKEKIDELENGRNGVDGKRRRVSFEPNTL